MKTNFVISRHFKNNIGLYAVILIAIPLATVYAIDLKNAPKDYEKFTLVSGCKLKDNEALYNIIKDKGENSLKEIAILSREYDSSFYNVMEASITYMDIFIIPESGIKETSLDSYISFEDDDSYYSSTNYIKDEIHYGILLNGIREDIFDYKDENCYLFLRKNGKHVKTWNENSKTDLAKSIIDEILK